jgi:hypothetical protein
MSPQEAKNILEALADGCSPITGEVLPLDSIVMEEEVIEALLVAIDALRGNTAVSHVQIDPAELMAVVALFRQFDRSASSNQLMHFLLGTRDFKIESMMQHPLYGKYAKRYQKGELGDYLEQWVKAENIVARLPKAATESELHPFFHAPIYNKLSEKGIEQLRTKVKALPMQHVANLSEALIERRKLHPRANEPWPEEEQRLLKIALEYTNDIEFLVGCFGRSYASIAAQSEKFLQRPE